MKTNESFNPVELGDSNKGSLNFVNVRLAMLGKEIASDHIWCVILNRISNYEDAIHCLTPKSKCTHTYCPCNKGRVERVMNNCP